MTTPSQTPAQPEPAQQTAPLDWARTLTTPTQQPDRAPGPEGPAPQSQAERAPATTVPGNTGPGTTVPGTTVPGATVSVAAADAHTALAGAAHLVGQEDSHCGCTGHRLLHGRRHRGRRRAAPRVAGRCRRPGYAGWRPVPARRSAPAGGQGGRPQPPSGRSAPAGSCLASSCRVDRYLAASRARDSSSRAARRATRVRDDDMTRRLLAAVLRPAGTAAYGSGARISRCCRPVGRRCARSPRNASAARARCARPAGAAPA